MSPGETQQQDHARASAQDAYLYNSASRRCIRCSKTPKARDGKYELRQRAVVLGWPEERIVVIDSDLGQSGASAKTARAFNDWSARSARAARASSWAWRSPAWRATPSDWHRLLEICALSGTLILDEDGIYDPAHFNDRCFLGLKAP